jgi:hypothetical protein
MDWVCHIGRRVENDTVPPHRAVYPPTVWSRPAQVGSSCNQDVTIAQTEDMFEMSGCPFIVGVKESDPGLCRRRDCGIAGCALTAVTVVPDDSCAQRGGDFGSVVVGVVVNDDDLRWRTALSLDAGDRAG